MAIADPSQLTRYFTAEGRLTPEGWLWLQSLIDYIRALEARIETLEP
jgi:hypothetical protein